MRVIWRHVLGIMETRRDGSRNSSRGGGGYWAGILRGGLGSRSAGIFIYWQAKKNKKKPLKGGGVNPLRPPPGSATGHVWGIRPLCSLNICEIIDKDIILDLILHFWETYTWVELKWRFYGGQHTLYPKDRAKSCIQSINTENGAQLPSRDHACALLMYAVYRHSIVLDDVKFHD